MSQMNYKLTMQSGKIVVMREMKIKDFQLATELTRDASSAVATEVKLQNEIIKMLIVSINDKVLKPSDKEVLDDILTMSEYIQLKMFIQELLGNAQKPTVEMVS